MNNNELGLHDDLQMLLETQLPEIHDTIGKLREIKLDDEDILNIADFRDVLQWITAQLKKILDIFPRICDSNGIEVTNLLEYLEWLQERKELLFELVNDINSVGPFLSKTLEIIERSLDQDPDKSIAEDEMEIINLIEKCSVYRDELDPWLNRLKKLLDTTLEFKEISNDHMDGLENVISQNIQKSFDLQEERFSSPVRHAPTFTLEQIITLLTKNGDSPGYSIPTFNNQEKKISDKYQDLEKSLPAIEKSLTDILPERIDTFGKRDVANIESLTKVLKEKYAGLKQKYDFMATEISELKVELVDKRWNLLFVNLNHEIGGILDDYESIKKKMVALDNLDIQSDIQDKLKRQMASKTIILERTFKIIFKAQEFSLLDAGIAAKTNQLHEKWLKIKISNVQDVRSMSSGITYELGNITRDMNGLTIKDKLKQNGAARRSVSEGSVSGHKQFGNALLKKMKIKPIVNGNKPNSLDDPNPFFDKRSKNNGKLVLNTVPALPHKENKEVKKSPEIKKKDEPDHNKDKCQSLEKLEKERIEYYRNNGNSKLPSIISKKDRWQYHSHIQDYIPSTPQKTPTSNSSWIPSSKRGQFLRPPTPLSVLITPTSSRRRPF
ncbi:Karyogamy protein KAR9 [Nakaseomyces bracarensis]|uniref:Karyogamy protein KAR9 n=1 Tax=Nakaseomyces bracarensis TaxID=273131 RepID=A0ABR4NS14_9SACH